MLWHKAVLRFRDFFSHFWKLWLSTLGRRGEIIRALLVLNNNWQRRSLLRAIKACIFEKMTIYHESKAKSTDCYMFLVHPVLQLLLLIATIVKHSCSRHFRFEFFCSAAGLYSHSKLRNIARNVSPSLEWGRLREYLSDPSGNKNEQENERNISSSFLLWFLPQNLMPERNCKDLK